MITNSLGDKRKIHYICGGDGLFAIYEMNDNGINNMYYIHKDYLGSYETITDSDGNIVEKLSFDPWGRRRNPTDWSFIDISTSFLFDRGFTGHEHLDNFDMINMNGRVYDPVVGYFSSPDPIIGIPKNSQGFNLYTYTKNNPLSYIDPSGYLESEVAELGGGPVDWVFELSRLGFLNSSTCFFAGVFAGAFEQSTENGNSVMESFGIAFTAAKNALAESEYALVSEDPHKTANRAFNEFSKAIDNYNDGKVKSSNADNTGVALHGVFTGAKIINMGVKRSPDGQLNFNFSSLVVQSAISGTAASLGNAKNINGLAIYTVMATLGGSSGGGKDSRDERHEFNVWYGIGFGFNINIAGIGARAKINFPNANIFSYNNGKTSTMSRTRWVNLSAGLSLANVKFDNIDGNSNLTMHMGVMDISTQNGLRYSPFSIGVHFGIIGFDYKYSSNYKYAGSEYLNARQQFYETTGVPMPWR